ncbi:MAG: Ppx/GppA phosphatase family protein [Candidatus Methanomethylophilaceae archaeon]
MSDDHKIVGFMDIGTNSIHLLVVEFIPGTTGVEIFHDKQSVRLGESLYKDGKIDQNAINKCRLVTDRFTIAAKNLGASEVIAFATCAAREAENRSELLDALYSDGLDVRIIPGEEEARLIKLGILGASGPRENILLIDIGGGSTEISISNGRENLYLDSLPIGAVRYSYGFPFNTNEPISDEGYKSYQRNVDLNSYRASKKIRELGFVKAIGSSGTLETLADLCSESRNGDSSYFTLDELVPLMSRLRKMNSEERSKVPKMGQNRVDIIVAGGSIAEELMLKFGIEKIEISHSGLKEGMKIDYLLNHGIVNFNVRESSVKALATRCQYDQTHAEEVRDKTFLIFDQMKALGIHAMTDEQRSLLGYAAILHDIGEFFNYQKHHVNSYNIIINSNMLGFDCGEINAIALMARFHHKKFPTKDDPLFLESNRGNIMDIMRCILILRMADSMDRHHTRSVKDIKLNVHNSVVTLELYSDEDIGMEIWKLEDLRHDFEIVFGKELRLMHKELTYVKNDNK